MMARKGALWVLIDMQLFADDECPAKHARIFFCCWNRCAFLLSSVTCLRRSSCFFRALFISHHYRRSRQDCTRTATIRQASIYCAAVEAPYTASLMAPHGLATSRVIGAVRLNRVSSVTVAGEPGMDTSGVSRAEEGLAAEAGSQSAL